MNVGFVKPARQFLTDDDIEHINCTLAHCMKKTSVRIVPAVASKSAEYEHAEDMVGLWAAALGLALTWWVLADSSVAQEWIGKGPVWAAGIVPVLAATIGGFLVGVFLSSHLGWLRRLFVTRRQLCNAARKRGQQIFANMTAGQKRPADPTLLVFIGVYEKSVQIVAPQMRERLPQAQVDTITQRAEECISRTFDSDAFCEVLYDLSNLLREEFPPHEGDSSAPLKLQTVA